MVDKQRQTAACRFVDQALRLRHSLRHRLLHPQVLAGPQGGKPQFVMRVHRRRHRDGVDVWVGEQLREVGRQLDRGIAPGQ
jgi:hypothetical protein